MKIFTTILFILFNLFSYSQNKYFFKSEYNQFEKTVSNEFEHKLVLTSHKFDNGTSVTVNRLGFRWSDTFYNKKDFKGWSDYYWGKHSIYDTPNIDKKNNSIKLDFFAKILTCESYDPNPDCWDYTGFTSLLFSKEFPYTMGYEKWEKYLNNKIDYMSDYPYIHFLAYNGDDLKIYLNHKDIFNKIYLNDVKYPRTIDNYNWLLQHEIKKIRIHNVRTKKNLDIEIPHEDRLTFKEVIISIQNHKIKIENEYYKK